MGGGGSLDGMNKTISNNLSLLNRRTKFDKDNLRHGPSTAEGKKYVQKPVDKKVLDDIRDKTILQRRLRILKRCLIIISVATLLGWGLYEVLNSPKAANRFAKNHNDKRDQLFETMIVPAEKGMTLKREYFRNGFRSAETKYKDGLRHQNSESYYQTGEQFRSAVYFYDTLINEVYFYKNGDTIKNFPMILDKNVHKMTLISPSDSSQIKFQFYDGKILSGSYEE